MGSEQLGIPERPALAVATALGIQTFVETGTYKAGTTLWAAQHFTHVYTIEASEKRYLNAVTHHANSHSNVTWLRGDSADVLPRLLRDIHEPCLFWLDAHHPWAADQMFFECPVLVEIMAVNAHECQEQHAIFVDDARMFTGIPDKPWNPAAWPTYQQLHTALWQGFRHVEIAQDVVFALPPAAREAFQEALKPVP